MKKHMTVASLVAGLGVATGLAAEPIQSLAAITKTATDYLQSQLPDDSNERQVVKAGTLDSRLRLPNCASPMNAQLAPGSSLAGTTTVAVSCDSPKTWTVYVPVRIARYTAVVVSRQMLARGARLGPTDLEVREADVNNVRGQGFSSTDIVVGSMLKRAVASQQVITANDICLICKGESVTIVARSENLMVKMPGQALSDGTLGEVVNVRNRDSKRLVQGRVAAAGVVEITL